MNNYTDFYDGLNDKRNILYRQMDTVSSLNRLLSTLYSELNNLKNYKINLKGENSYILKSKIEDIISKISPYESKIQELIKSKNGFPIYQLGDIENISLIKTLASIDYKPSIVLNNILKELTILKKLTEETIDTASKENDYFSIYLLSKVLYEINFILLDYQL